jgi:hypothetical protein
MVSKNVNPRVLALLYVIGDILEILSAVSLAVFIWLKIVLPEKSATWPERNGWLIAILSFLLGVVVRRYGNVLNSRAEDERKRTMHEITERRLKTLEAVNVEEDILEVLSLRLNKPALPVEGFITWLESRIGRERTQERLPVILRYTRVLPEAIQQPLNVNQQPAAEG